MSKKLDEFQRTIDHYRDGEEIVYGHMEEESEGISIITWAVFHIFDWSDTEKDFWIEFRRWERLRCAW